MATTIAGINAQLTTEAAKPNTTEPSLKTRELARWLVGMIHYYHKELFYTKLTEGADPNFTGLDDRNQHVNPPLFYAIAFNNVWAFDELLKRGANVHKAGKGTNVPLFEAAANGNAYMVRELLRYGADPLDYRKGTCLPLMLEKIGSNALFESQSRWRYENESPDTDNATLQQEILDFHLQQGVYTPPKASAVIPFVAPKHVIHVHFNGKLEILGLLLARHVSPTIPVSGTTRSPLAIVQNPTKYSSCFRSDDKEALEYIGTEEGHPNTLLFNMTLVNKRNTGTSSRIVVHYDLEPSRKLIEAAIAHLNPHLLAVTESLSKGMQETGNRLGTQLSSAQDELKAKLEKAQAETARLQAELTAAQNETKQLAETVNGVGKAVERVDAAVKGVDEATKKVDQAVQDVREVGHFAEMEETARFKAFIKSYPNAEEAYNTILSRLKSVHKSAQAVAGGGVVVSEGSLALVAKVLDVSTNVVESIPLVGPAASKFFGLAASATREVDGIRQTNIYENIAAMVPATGAGRIFESVARKLTLAYLPQFQRLLTREEVEAQTSCSTPFVQNALKSRFKSPAERIGEFAIVFMIEDVFHNMHALQNEVKNPNGLEMLLLNAVMQHKPTQGVTTFWNTITEKLGINQIPTRTQSGTVSAETWHPEHFWTMPGIKVENSQGNAIYFAGNGTQPEKFGFRSGSLADVEALGLMPTTEAAVLTQTMPAAPPSVSAVDSTPSVPSLGPRIMPAYENTTASPRQREVYEVKGEKDKLAAPTPSAPKRSKSPFGGFKMPALSGLRRGQAPITTS